MGKNLFINSLIVFIICFLIIFTYRSYQDYEYYKVYPKEELSEVFSLKGTLIWNAGQAFSGSVIQMVIFIPILAILEKSNKKNILKILIAVLLTLLISFALLMNHIRINLLEK